MFRIAFHRALKWLFMMEFVVTAIWFFFAAAGNELETLAGFITELCLMSGSYEVLQIVVALVVLDKFGETFHLGTYCNIIPPDRKGPSCLDDEWLIPASSAHVPVPVPSYESPSVETIWINPSTGFPMLNGPGSFDTVGHLWME